MTWLPLALMAGLIAGLRVFTPLAAVSWGARLGHLPLNTTWLAFLGYQWTPWILSALAIVEFVTDQLPSTPSRKVPMQFGARLISGGLCGAAIGLPTGGWMFGLVSGLVGAVAGTFGGAAARSRAAAALGRDLPAALIEDAAAVLLGAAIVGAL